MSRTNLFFKVEVEHDPDEKPERIGEEICRRLLKMYGVRGRRAVQLHERGGIGEPLPIRIVCSYVRRKKPSVMPAM